MESKVTEFKMIIDDSAPKFQQTINELLKKGWELHGISYVKGEEYPFFYQAMIKQPEPTGHYSLG